MVLWAVMELLLLVIRSHKQTLHTKDDVKREGEARDDTTSSARESRVQAGFSDNRHPDGVFLKLCSQPAACKVDKSPQLLQYEKLDKKKKSINCPNNP